MIGEEILVALERALAPDIAFEVEDPRVSDDGLLIEELAYVANAVPKRRREYASGRRAARSAFAKIGLPSAAIVAGQNRAPIWPQGAIGSISHCQDLCVALVAKAKSYRSLGVDVEARMPLAEDLVETVCTTQEMDKLSFTSEIALLEATSIFSAKEATYKALFPVTQELINFHDLTIDFVSLDEFVAVFTSPKTEFEAGFVATGHSIELSQHVVHIVVLS